jgi:RNA polymerase sigma-70 factor (ECF subfamily)
VSTKDVDFQTIYETYQPQISRYLTRLVGAEDAEDVAQEVFAKLDRGLSSFRGESKLSTWVYRIATNAAVDRLRSPSFQRTVPMSEEELTEVEGLIAVEIHPEGTAEKPPTADEQLVRKEMNECIRDFVERLPVNYRTVLVLSELEGLKNREVAEVLGISLETVKIRLHRARAKLKQMLDAHCRFYSDERGELACDLREAFD